MVASLSASAAFSPASSIASAAFSASLFSPHPVKNAIPPSMSVASASVVSFFIIYCSLIICNAESAVVY